MVHCAVLQHCTVDCTAAALYSALHCCSSVVTSVLAGVLYSWPVYSAQSAQRSRGGEIATWGLPAGVARGRLSSWGCLAGPARVVLPALAGISWAGGEHRPPASWHRHSWHWLAGAALYSWGCSLQLELATVTLG